MSSADACADSEEVGFLALINDYRAASGLRPLSLSSSLSSAAAYHSVDMAANGYLAHTLLDGTTVEQNMANFGYEGGTHGENIAAGTETAAEMLERLSEAEIADLIYKYGEERLSRRIARRIVWKREIGEPVKTTKELAETVDRDLTLGAAGTVDRRHCRR